MYHNVVNWKRVSTMIEKHARVCRGVATSVLRAASILMVGLACTASALAIRVFPTPRSIKPVGLPIDLDGAAPVSPVIVVLNPSEMMQAGINVIQNRLTEQGGVPWRMATPEEAKSESLVIYLAAAGSGAESDALIESTTLGVTPESPGPQGYAITCRKTAKGMAVFVVGSDGVGALYGCVTLAHFIVSDSDKKMRMQLHDVRDWPDFKHRMLGSSDPFRRAWGVYDKLVTEGRHAEAEVAGAEFDAVMKAHVDWMLWNKINLVVHFVPSVRNAAQMERMANWVRYMEVRGMGLTWCQSSPVGTAVENRRGCVKMGSTEYCWSDDERHQAQALRRAQTIRDLHVKHFALHMIDTDGPDPEHWSQRCDACKHRFGDDRAAADFNIFQFYYQAIRELAPACSIEFVPVPYKAWPFYQQGTMELSIEWLKGNPEAAEKQRMSQAALAYFKRLDELLPKDVYITFREHGRTPSAAYKKAFGNRPLAVWWWQFPVRGWQSFFHNMGRYAKTWDFDDPRDLIFITSHDLPVTERIVTLFNNEYAWNTDAPGSAVLEEAYDYRIGPELLEPTSVTFPFLDDACRETYGSVAGPTVAEVCKQQLSLMYVARPRVTRVINGESHNLYNDDANLLRDLLPQMRIQADAAARATEICARFFAGKPVLDGAARSDLPIIYRSALWAKHAAGLQALRWECDRALLSGDVQTACAKAAEGLRLLETRKRELAQLEEALASYPATLLAADSVEHDLETFDVEPFATDFTALADASVLMCQLRAPTLSSQAISLRLPNPLEPAGGLMSHTTQVAARETEAGLELTFTLREDAATWPAIPSRPHDELLTSDAGEQRAYVAVYVRTAGGQEARAFLFDWRGNRLDGRCAVDTLPEATAADWDPRWQCHVVRCPNLRDGLDLTWNGTWNLDVVKDADSWTATVLLPWSTLADSDGNPVDRDGLQFVIERYWRSREPFGPGEFGRLGDFGGRWIPWNKDVKVNTKEGENNEK